jgi:Rrf2 family iron-sulfur cluster assembly transcriptional regulator
MRLSTKARFAVSAMMYLATRNGKGPSNAHEICADQDISVSYLEQLFANLRKEGLVVGVRGPGGGYRLGRPAADITIADIVTAVDDHAYVKRADNVIDLIHGEHGRVQRMWRDLSTRLYEFLGGITLAEAISEPEGPARGEPREERPAAESAPVAKEAAM